MSKIDDLPPRTRGILDLLRRLESGDGYASPISPVPMVMLRHCVNKLGICLEGQAFADAMRSLERSGLVKRHDPHGLRDVRFPLGKDQLFCIDRRLNTGCDSMSEHAYVATLGKGGQIDRQDTQLVRHYSSIRLASPDAAHYTLTSDGMAAIANGAQVVTQPVASTDPIAAAIGLKSQNPDWSDRRIAKAAGCTPCRLTRSERYQRVKAVFDQVPAPPSGYKTADGDIDAEAD